LILISSSVACARSASDLPFDVDDLVRKRAAQTPSGKFGDAYDVAYAALFLASDEARHITGTTLAVDGGKSALMHVAIVEGALGGRHAMSRSRGQSGR
jgi:NAD(P)-dependent dehydrogenase (short-subunit alcohol dehydrogenase family)